MDLPPLQSKKKKYFRVKLAYQSQPITVVSTTENNDEDGAETFIDIPACPCGKVLHDIQKVVAFCAVGGDDEPLCEQCASNRCDICGKSICHEHTAKDGDKKCCTTHGFWEMLKLSFSPSKPK